MKGLAQAGKKAGRIATEGLIAQYIHAGSRCMTWSWVHLNTVACTLCVLPCAAEFRVCTRCC